MSGMEISRFQENEACRGCEFLQECRELKQPRRTSCWIRHCRQKYWKPKLKAEADERNLTQEELAEQREEIRK
jgi:hypothetical protein